MCVFFSGLLWVKAEVLFVGVTDATFAGFCYFGLDVRRLQFCWGVRRRLCISLVWLLG